jgi:AraC-like DNA-binding protein
MESVKEIFIQPDGFPALQHELFTLSEKKFSVHQSYKLHVQRYKKQNGWNIEDTCKVVYNPASGKNEGTLDIIFCVAGNTYCNSKDRECDACKFTSTPDCKERINSVDIIHCSFSQKYLSSITLPAKGSSLFSDAVISFNHPHTFSRTLPVCAKTRNTLDSILQNPYNGTLEQLYMGAQAQLLLLNSMECMVGEQEDQVFTCKFLANSADREKITRAREILIEHIGNPITIKALSRKVAMNECYLKKGFKEVFGCTIFEFYQGQRMDHAKYLLYEKGLSVTEVSMLLGYSSISHFSTAFKKHTGLKPCELLLRN